MKLLFLVHLLLVLKKIYFKKEIEKVPGKTYFIQIRYEYYSCVFYFKLNFLCT